jgi:hypothetical protein
VGLLAAMAINSSLVDTEAFAVGMLDAIKLKICKIEGPLRELTLLEGFYKYYNDIKNGGRKL